MPSLRARLLDTVALPILRGRSWTAQDVRARVAAQAARPAVVRAPGWLGRFARHTVAEHAGWPVHELTPLAGPAGAVSGPVTVLYLHGGGYIAEPVAWHWLLVARLARDVPARVVMPLYPLAGWGLPADVVSGVADLLDELLGKARAAGGRLVLMGDSAGGGLALASAQAARARGRPQPDRISLISPWLDVTMTHPDQPAIARHDHMLRIDGLAEAGRCYAGPLDPADPLVSPLNGPLAGLAPLTVLCGTHDVLLPDSRRLAAEAGLVIDYHEAPGLPHCYPLAPIPEAAAARARLIAACRADR
ncbi:alpha/beta hydrolase fold domain-containing protein [Pseudofrankia inefficax]|uniref:Esterase n=1 Tax=Pseudofrankia inefficax (strain DSM 45817 / CECT 9037 / DDB 130130 / EuI1c) TaxID=298654 RepID=E3J432_PSEI1|nr:alpha/beta hydrolase fold domain-containing protein [Pseudofrankia inefficax]ADP81811.1 esterase [Pseudofrankia inefficax]